MGTGGHCQYAYKICQDAVRQSKCRRNNFANSNKCNPSLNLHAFIQSLEEDESRPFYDSDSDTSNSKKPKFSLDPDHRLLLRNTKPLLQSRNASVVMAVCQLYHHAAPRNEVMVASKALIRLLRGHREVQSVVLHCIASISITRKVT